MDESWQTHHDTGNAVMNASGAQRDILVMEGDCISHTDNVNDLCICHN